MTAYTTDLATFSGALLSMLTLWTLAHIAGRIAARLGDMNR